MTPPPSVPRPLAQLRDMGVSIWLDTLSRDMLDSGHFARLVRERAVTGATSNPTIFEQAITRSDRYDAQIAHLAAGGMSDPREIFLQLAVDDVRRAADVLAPVHARTGGTDGFVSLECTPDIADDTDATVAQALDLWRRLARPNVMVKVPATAAGVPAIEELTARGVNVNVTLLFGLERYTEVIDAYLRGLERRAREGRPLDGIASAASFFVSRIDVKVDARLPQDSPLRGRIAILQARQAHALWRERFAGGRWEELRRAGANLQRPLWASTGTKDPSYSDVLYVEELVLPGAINTMPERTLEAFAEHGRVRSARVVEPAEAERAQAALAAAGVDLRALAGELEREGVRAFCASYAALLACVASKLPAPSASSAHAASTAAIAR